MGLKKSNYEVKSLGITLPEAYAYVRDITINGTSGAATIVVQASRDMAINKKPLEERNISFTVNREENPYVTAYRVAKKYTTSIYNKELLKLEQKEVDGYFADWSDDIL